MWFLVDLTILAIIGLCVFFGYRRGLIGVAFKIVSFVLAVLIAFVLFRPVSNFIISNTSLDDKIKSVVIEKVEVENEAEQNEENKKVSNIAEYIQNSLKNATTEAASSAVVAVADEITITIVNLIVFVIVYILARLILLLTKGVLDFIAGLPIIKQSNKLGGIIYGLFKGLVITYLGLAIISLIAISSTAGIIELINKSILGNIMYNNNLILMLFFKPKY